MPAEAELMKAAVFDAYGGPEVLRYADVPKPRPGRGQALVQVEAAGINAFDLMAREGRYRPNPTFPHITGSDFGGTVVEFGPEVESPIQVGERVTAWTVVATCQRCEQCTTGHPNRCALEYRYLGAHLPGSYAQYITLPAVNLVRIPDRMTWEEAAAFPAPYGTAWHMLVTRANLRPAETILVQSASAAVSIAGIQIAKLIGAYVYATTSSDWKVERAREVGADEVINYTQLDFQQEIMRRTGKRGVDIVLEHVGGPVFDKSVRSLTRGGRLVTTGGTASYDVTTSVAHIFHKELSIIGSNSYIRHELEVMMPLVERGLLHPVVDRVFPLQEAAAAHQHVMGGNRFGKVVLRVTH